MSFIVTIGVPFDVPFDVAVCVPVGAPVGMPVGGPFFLLLLSRAPSSVGGGGYQNHNQK